PQGSDSDPGVDGGLEADGGSVATASDARVPPPDGIPQGLAPCDEAPYHSDFAFVEDKIFATSCMGDCHTGPSPSADMDLSVGHAYTSRVNVASRTDGWMLVVPNDSPNSMLMVQLGAEPGPPLEGYMPWGQPQLCQPLMDVIRRWIVAGAPPR